ncbi:MAG: hypothetical protein OXH69_10585 [Acidobacteria bacterium]|nr:hypothetical protein [Acidobacteriota bacterium]
MRVEIGRESRTGCPVVRVVGGAAYVGFFPVLKLQVDAWIQRAEPPPLLTLDRRSRDDLQERVERPLGGEQYQEAPDRHALDRPPPDGPRMETPVGWIATHLTVWSESDDLTRADRFPTPESEWGRMQAWLGASPPSSEEWARAQAELARVTTRSWLEAVLAAEAAGEGPRWAEPVRTLAARLREQTPATDRGLPFMRLGVYELTHDAADHHLDDRVERRPRVAGQCAVWPALPRSSADRDRSLTMLQSALPMVGARLWWSSAVAGSSEAAGDPRVRRLAVTDIAEVPGLADPWPAPRGRSRSRWTLLGLGGDASHSDGTRKTRSGRADTRTRRRSTAFRTRYVTMTRRCPLCYGTVPKPAFHRSRVWCDPAAELLERHTTAASTIGEGGRRDVIPKPYHALAQATPGRVRSVTVAGESATGKGVFLLVLSAMLHRAHSGWAFGGVVEPCILQDERVADLNVNLQRQLDRLLVSGDLPVRTPEHARALRSPWLFSRPRRGWHAPHRASERRIAVIFNDIAGEILGDAHRSATNEHFTPHLACTTDVVYLVPAHELAGAARRLGRFRNTLEAVEHVEDPRTRRAVDLTQVNLILAINQIDRLRHNPESPLGELLRISLREPYGLAERDERSAAAYLSAMQQVHHDLVDWLSEHEPGLLVEARHFGSLRVCGMSATGSAVIARGAEDTVERSLAFAPAPVRVTDPLLWILRECRYLS